MKRLSDIEIQAEVKKFRQGQNLKEKHTKMFGRDLKSVLNHQPMKQSAGSKRRVGAINKSASTNIINNNKNKERNSLLQQDQIMYKKLSTQQSHDKQIQRIQYFGVSKIQETQKKSELPKESIKEYLKFKAPRAPSQINACEAISINMRKLVISWIIELAYKLRFKHETLFHTVYIFDCMLEIKTSQFSLNPEQLPINLDNFQLLAMACMLISSKYEEINPPLINIFVQFSQFSYSKKQIIEMQAKILSQNNFNLTFPTRYTFIANYFDNLCDSYGTKKKKFMHLCQYLCTLSLLELWQDANEEQIGNSILFLAHKVLGIPQSTKDASLSTNSKKQNKKTCRLAWKLKQIWQQNYGSITSYIYDCDKYSFVGGIYLRQT